MMRGYLLDTHALIWLCYRDERLSMTVRREMESGVALWYSIVSLWEIGIKEGKQGFDLELGRDWNDYMVGECQSLRVNEAALQASDCRAIQDLPLHHRDPFDRMLIAQAKRLQVGVISKDGKLDSYGVERLW